jgi:hypothetical protein
MISYVFLKLIKKNINIKEFIKNAHLAINAKRAKNLYNYLISTLYPNPHTMSRDKYAYART